jgi:hypothetical protein
MDKTQYLKTHAHLLAALQWLHYEKHGLGILLVKDDLIRFKPYDQLGKTLKKMCREKTPKTHVIVQFFDGVVADFETSRSPQQCFEIMRPQLKDFFLKFPENIEV